MFSDRKVVQPLQIRMKQPVFERLCSNLLYAYIVLSYDATYLKEMGDRFADRIDEWVADILLKSQNIATEQELREQSKVAINLFVEADVDSSESLSFEELKSLCEMAGLPMEEDEEEALVKIDLDDSGSLDIEEWVKWWLRRISTLPNPIKQQEAIARNTFGKFDTDSSGYLDCSELGKLTTALGASFTEDELAEALSEVDVDNSGVIDITEFVGWWTNRAALNRNNTTLISFKMRKLALKAAQVFSTDIFAAAWNGDVELVKAFLVGEPRLAQASDTSEYGEGWTALHYACYQGHVTIVETLLAGRPDVNRANDLGFSALFYAAQRGHASICSLLMDAGADPSVTGVCQPIGLLESDGPPPLTTLAATAATSNGETNRSEDIFMCAVEHVLDHPELRSIFKSSSKCTVPQAPDYAAVAASVSLLSGCLSFEVQQLQKAISHLPIKEWELKVRMDMQMDTDMVPAEVYADLVGEGLSFVLRTAAVHPKQIQQYSVRLDRTWVKKLHFLCSLHKMKRLQLLEASAAGLQGVWSELRSIYNSVDASYRNGVSLIDFVYIIINKCPDRKNTKELRHSLRAALEQVTIENSAVDVSGGLRKRGPGPESKEQEPPSLVDLTDPVAKLNAAMKELHIRKVAAEKVRQAQEEERKKTEAANPAGGEVQPTNSELTVKWCLQEGDQPGFPIVTVCLSAVNAWGAGDFSSGISATILETCHNR